jgi:hypothetical protein
MFQGTLPGGHELAVKNLLGTAEHGLQQLHNEVLLLTTFCQVLFRVYLSVPNFKGDI